MSEFRDLEKKAQDYVEEHPEQADKGINEAAGFAERETDHQHDQQIDRAVDAAEQHIGQGQNQQGNQGDQDQQANQNGRLVRFPFGGSRAGCVHGSVRETRRGRSTLKRCTGCRNANDRCTSAEVSAMTEDRRRRRRRPPYGS